MEGFVKMVMGSGTFVSFAPPKTASISPPPLSGFGNRLANPSPLPKRHAETISFDLHQPCPVHFMMNDWKQAVKSALHDCNFLVDYHSEPDGIYVLRDAIATHLVRTQGMRVTPDEIVIVNGSMHGIALLTQMYVNPGDPVYIQDPCYKASKFTIQTLGGNLVPLPDQMDLGELMAQDCRIAFVTPNHQYPHGQRMSFHERIQLLKWAKETEILIIEDDMESDFRWTGRPIESIKSLDSGNRVVYLGTFSITLLPSLRIGYAVLPSSMKDLFLEAKRLSGNYTTSIVEQLSLAHFIKNGKYTRHIRRIRKVYAEKQAVLQRLLQDHVSDLFDWGEIDTGLHMYGWWKKTENEYRQFTSLCNQKGVFWEDTADYYLDNGRLGGLFGFSHLSETEMEKAVSIMAVVRNEFFPR